MLGVLENIGRGMRAIPGPTDNWAAIIGHLAWPVTLLVVIFLLRGRLQQLLNVLEHRIRNDVITANRDGVRLERDDRLFALRPQGEAQGPTDEEIIELLFEFVSDESKLEVLDEWIFDNAPVHVSVEDFITNFEYEDLRRRALRELINGG